MKKSFVQVLSIVSALSLLFISCAVSPDQMLDDFNKEIFQDLGGGDYVRGNGEPGVSTTLIKLPVYRVAIDGTLRIDVLRDFLTYEWTLVNNATEEEKKLVGDYCVVIYPPTLHLEVNGDYSIKLIVKNRDDVLLMDSAKLVVYENK